jgi:hypothetical protein
MRVVALSGGCSSLATPHRVAIALIVTVATGRMRAASV